MKSRDLRDRSDGELLGDVDELVGSHRTITAKLVQYLEEIEQRRLHLRAGFSSMFEFCVERLGMGEGEAFRRVLAARLAHRFPVIHDLLASGAVHLSTLEVLREHLTAENHADLLRASSGKSKRAVMALVALRFPRPDVPAVIRRLPSDVAISTDSIHPLNTAFALVASEASPANDRRARIEPLSPARFKVEFTASAELREKLEACRDLMSHANPSRDLAMVVERAIDLLLADLRKKRLRVTSHARATSKNRPAKTAETDGITNAVRRRVFERDGEQCTFVSPDRRRCTSRTFLELDHIDPRALGGASEAENLRVRCRAHNRLWAEDVYGRDHVERHFLQKKRDQPATSNVPSGTSASSISSDPSTDGSHVTTSREISSNAGSALPEAWETVRTALRALGFRPAEAREAVAKVARRQRETPSVNQALREALRVATDGMFIRTEVA